MPWGKGYRAPATHTATNRPRPGTVGTGKLRMPELAMGLESSGDTRAAVPCRGAIQPCPADSPWTESGLAVALASEV